MKPAKGRYTYFGRSRLLKMPGDKFGKGYFCRGRVYRPVNASESNHSAGLKRRLLPFGSLGTPRKNFPSEAKNLEEALPNCQKKFTKALYACNDLCGLILRYGQAQDEDIQGELEATKKKKEGTGKGWCVLASDKGGASTLSVVVEPAPIAISSGDSSLPRGQGVPRPQDKGKEKQTTSIFGVGG
ncbi:hypothetical protein FNV43_RR21874 [Rhamnella rubrinervis]|uniref:Uncharacterized protein n=1 Tax=Rhamnella rubrinervis TaxID=2594499 RepID=A0A8K0GS04_9ROSA|nr:hypothetical protein FNV43_RR21874 [Rhamnella rubrinervis]